MDDIESCFKIQRKYNNGNGPYVNSEFYTGKLDHWKEKHNKVTTEKVKNHLDKILQIGANVNMYMYYRGTNFYFFNGANGGSNQYQPDPTFYRAYFEVDEVGDTFLNPTGWTHGTVFVNCFNIGRYWIVGPQLTLCIPKYILKKEMNELIVFEYESQFNSVPTMSFDTVHQIDTI